MQFTTKTFHRISEKCTKTEKYYELKYIPSLHYVKQNAEADKTSSHRLTRVSNEIHAFMQRMQ